MFRITPGLSRLSAAAAGFVLFSLTAHAHPEGQEALQPHCEQAAPARERPLPTDPLMVGPVAWSVLAEPIHPVQGTDGRIHLQYELHLANASRYTVHIDSIEVLDARHHRATGVNKGFSTDGKDVTGKVRAFSLPVQERTAVDYSDQMEPGQGGVAYFDVTYGRAHEVPRSLTHRIVASFQLPSGERQTYSVIGKAIPVSREQARVIAPPLSGDNWVNLNGGGEIVAAHRYTVQSTNGGLRPPEHFAIDFIRLDAQGHLYVGDPADLKNWFYYGSDILSVADGRVVEVVDGRKDQIPGQRPTDLKADEYAGNYVIVDIGRGHYASYAHILPGSILVSKGDPVRQGQVLGKLGNSGNTDGPHLHFQVTDSASFLNTNGLPFVFSRMDYQGHFEGTLDTVGEALFTGKKSSIDTSGAGNRRLQMPLTLDLFKFE